MSTKYKFHNPDGTYFVTFTVVGWVDVFIRDEYRNILINSFNYCTIKKGACYTCMGNNEIEQKTDYIHENTVEHGFTNLAECYDWRSAIDYTGEKGVVEVEIL